MRKRQAVVAVALLGAPSGLLALALLASGCSPMARHAVLSKLVDGIPPYMPTEERARPESEATVHAGREAEKPSRREGRARVKKRSFFLHDPFEAEDCLDCHGEAASASSPVSQRKPRAPSRRVKVATGEGFLRMDVTALCFECHDEYSPESTPPVGLSLHGPVASGWCVTCHDPHKSRNPSLLRYAPTARLCLQCHERIEVATSSEAHIPKKPEEAYTLAARRRRSPNRIGERIDRELRSPPVVKDCTRCHDPHRGRDHALLRDQVAAPTTANDVVAQPRPAQSRSTR